MHKTKLYVDALALAPDRMSGIGHLTLEMLRALSKSNELELILVVPLWKAKRVERHAINNARIKTVFLPARVFSVLLRMRLLPPVDLFIGKGVYLFPNYRNWPLIRSKSLTYIHDATFLKFPETVNPKNLRYLKNNVRTWIKRADTILTLSESSKSDLVSYLGIPAGDVLVLPCGIDTEVFYERLPTDIAEVKKKYGITAEQYIIYVGNFEPRKNLDRLLDAYRLLSDERKSNFALLMAGGGGWLNESTLEKIKTMESEGLNIMKTEKYVEDEDLPALISGATILVQPSLYEGFGIPPLQAMACATPVTVSNNSSLPEVVGDAALFFEATDTQDISDKIEALVSDTDLQYALAKKGLAQAENFSWDASAQRLIQYIQGTR